MRLTLEPERASKIRLWILIPTRELNCLAPHHVTLLGTLRQHGIWYSLRTLPGDSLVTRSRNNLADIFLNESSDDENDISLWLDDDIIFSPESVLQLLACNKDFIAAPYTKKGLHMDRLAAAARKGWKSSDIANAAGTPNVNFLLNQVRLNEPVPVLDAGSGFWLIKRKVFRQLVDSFADDYVEEIDGKPYYFVGMRYKRLAEERAHYGRDHAHDFFGVGVWRETREYISEDWYLCRMWRKLGGTVWCAFWINTYHLGPYMYPMNMDAVIGLLTETGGVIHGPTWAEDINNATTQVRTGTPDNGNIDGDGRRVIPVTEADEAAVKSSAGPLGR